MENVEIDYRAHKTRDMYKRINHLKKRKILKEGRRNLTNFK